MRICMRFYRLHNNAIEEPKVAQAQKTNIISFERSQWKISSVMGVARSSSNKDVSSKTSLKRDGFIKGGQRDVWEELAALSASCFPSSRKAWLNWHQRSYHQIAMTCLWTASYKRVQSWNKRSRRYFQIKLTNKDFLCPNQNASSSTVKSTLWGSTGSCSWI